MVVEPHHPPPSPPGPVPAGGAGAATSSVAASSSSVVTGLLLQYHDSVSFFTAYVVQIVTTHILYAVFVYGMATIDTYAKYTTTLGGQFKIYGLGLLGATYCQAWFQHHCGYPKHVAFWGTTALFAVFNYFLITWSVQTAISRATTKNPPSSRSPHNNKTKQPRPPSSNTPLLSDLQYYLSRIRRR